MRISDWSSDVCSSDLQAKSQAERQGSERAAINAPIQGTSADIIKRAMVRMGPALGAAGLDQVKMLLQVHDVLVFELPEGDIAAARGVIRQVSASAAAPDIKLSVPPGVDIGTGPSWGAAPQTVRQQHVLATQRH